MRMVDLASTLCNLPERRGRAPWPDYEYVRGWGVFGLPATPVTCSRCGCFRHNDFSPYRTLWHRNPKGEWSIYVSGARLETACPRYYGPATTHTAFARIAVNWSGPASLRITMGEPSLEWNLDATETPVLRVINALGPRMPMWTWRSGALLRARELLAQHVLHLGDLRLSGTTPSGHTGILMPQRMCFIHESTAVLDGQDLGRPTSLEPNPRIGEVPLPARGVLAVRLAAWKILDPDEYARMRAATAEM
jgi:hypothetical protein